MIQAATVSGTGRRALPADPEPVSRRCNGRRAVSLPAMTWLLAMPWLAWAGCAGGPTAGAPGAGRPVQDPPEPAPIRAGLPPAPDDYAAGFDALHYAFEIDLTSGSGFRGRAVIDLARPARADTLALDLTGLRVTGVRAGGPTTAGGPVSAVQRGGTVRIPVPDLDTVRVEIGYGGTPDDGLLLGRTPHGEPAAFADNWPNRARFWIPTLDHPGDKATVDWTVRVPADRDVVAGGRRVKRGGGPIQATGRSSAGPDRPTDGVWRWRMDVPIPTYTMVLGAADFAVTVLDACAAGGVTGLRPDGCVPVSVWSFPPDSGAAARSFARAPEIVELYSRLVAPFPYPELAHVQSATRFGGMENAGAIFYAARAVAGGRDLDGLIAHETAHQWFGDAVTPADWRHLWLSEGFASYFGPLFFEETDGPAALQRRMADMRRDVVGSDVVHVPVVDDAMPASLFDLLNANSYDKGAWVLHMLRTELGDDAFFDGVRRYYRAHRHGTARTADLRRAMEAAAGRDLGWFFDQWIHAPGYPVLRVSHAWNSAASEAVIIVEQAQAESWPTYRFPLTLELRTARGPVRRTVRVSERRTELRVALDGRPEAVRIDPDVTLLHAVGR